MGLPTQSRQYTLNREDIVKIVRHVVIVSLAAGITYFLSVLGDINFGKNTVLVVPVLSLILKSALQFFDGQAPK